ncbi:MAG: O-acetylhomoserine aminocarboxypropyltransferase/cysteine synthase [Bacillota bacterium]|nr:O-acetylhomoserine aminocarboxypropyltransferase/cysteine synthase [Bacillota bacterium]
MADTWGLGTRCVQSGWQPKNGEPRVVPIYQSTTFKFDSSEQMGRLFDLEESGYFYTRLANPTNDAIAARINALEGGVAAILTSSGQAASFYAITNIAGTGDHIVASAALYGGTFNLFANSLKNFGIDFTFVPNNASDAELAAAFRPNTKALFGESLTNPSLEVLDIERYANVAHAHGVPLIVDNTFPTPIFCRPLEWGADIVIHSTSKYFDGHATSVGGVVVDGGSFDWMAHSERFPMLTTPEETYHGTNFSESFGKAAYYARLLAVMMRDFGAIPSPQNAFLTGLGIETLHLRMARHVENARQVARYLVSHPNISWVRFPELETDSQYALAQKYLPNGSCGVISFGVRGGREAAMRFMDALQLCAVVTHVADTRSCVLHPASTTHRQMSDSELEAAGVSPDLIRLSVGIEDAADIIADIEQALAIE